MAKKKADVVASEVTEVVEVSADTVVRDLLQQCLDKGIISDREFRIKVRSALKL